MRRSDARIPLAEDPRKNESRLYNGVTRHSHSQATSFAGTVNPIVEVLSEGGWGNVTDLVLEIADVHRAWASTAKIGYSPKAARFGMATLDDLDKHDL